MFKVEDVQMVRAMGSGVAGGHYGFATWTGVKRRREWSSGRRLMRRRSRREARVRLGEQPVNCLQKALAMEVVMERLLLPNMIGWLGATAVFFPES